MGALRKRGIFFALILQLSFIGFGFAKEDSSYDLEPIVVSKAKVHLLPSYSFDSTVLESLPFNSPVEALAVLPVDLQSRSPKSAIQTDFSLRGCGFQGVLILMNGQRLNDPQTAHHNSDIPLTKVDIERIEVTAGVSSSVFGPDAIGGAINFLLKKPKAKEMAFEAWLGQHKTKGGILSVTEKRDNLGVRLSLEREESDGFREDTDFKKFTSSLNSSFDIPDGSVDLILGYQEKEFGAFDFYTPGSGYPSKEWTKTWLLNSGFNLSKGALLIKPNFLWRRHYDKFMLDKTQRRTNYLNHHRSDLYTPNLYLQAEVTPLGKAGFGIEYGQERISSTNLGKRSRSHKSIFVDDSKDLTSRLSLGLSARFDDFSGFSDVYTGSLSLRYKLSQQGSLHLGFSRSMRIPSFTELYYNDPTTIGDANLSAEKSLNYQAGYDYKKENLSLGVALFFRQENDFIDWVKRSTAQAKWQVENITDAQVSGIESRASFKINDCLDLNSNYTFINKRLDSKVFLYKYGPNYIRHLANAGLFFNFSFGTQALELTYKKKPGRDGWLLLGARFSYNLNKYAQVFLEAANLFNVEYQEIEGIPQPGRWVEGGLRLNW